LFCAQTSIQDKDNTAVPKAQDTKKGAAAKKSAAPAAAKDSKQKSGGAKGKK
jgi:hypothetical protein